MIKLWQGDCTDVRDVSFADVMVVDPPYSAHVHSSAVSQSPGRGVRKRDLGFDSLSPELLSYISAVSAHIKRWSVVYSDIESLSLWREQCVGAGATYIRPIPWIRWSMPQLSGDRPPSGCEMVSCFWGTQSGRKSWNGPGNLTHLDHKCLRGEDKHRAEKPLDQALDLVTWFSEPGETIYDPCMGHGTMGLACKILGRKYCGVEISTMWFDRASDRIERGGDNLSVRDEERYQRWLKSQSRRAVEQERIAANTNRVRAKLDAAST